MPHLLPGEKVVASRHIHWVMPLKAMALPVLLVVLVVLGGDVLLRGNLGGEVRLVLTLLALALAGAWAIVTWIRWTATSFTITDQRVILDSGVFSRSSRVIPIDRVQDVATRRSLVGRILGYGTVEIDAAGSQGAERLDYVPAPDAFRDQVFTESEQLRRAPL
ncbi:MAG: PH domain-containing protein [Chloroflexi bacterium]|nr:MAG: PH domain-containing protein [Chloroflexota bacterium]